MQTAEIEQTTQKLIDQGNELRKAGKLDEAVTVFRQAVESDSNAYEAYHFLGETFGQQDKLDAAADAYYKAIEINPDYYWSYHCLGQVLFWQEKLDEAISASCKAIELNENQSAFHNQLGQTLAQKGELDEAIRCYRNAIALQLDFWEAYHYWGEALLKQQRWTEAAGKFFHAIELNPNFSWSYQGLGDSLTKQSKWSEAAIAYSRAIELNPTFPASYVYLVNAQIYLQQWSEAEKYISLALSIFPKPPQILADKVRLLQDIGYLQEAEERYQEWSHPEPINNKVGARSALVEFQLGGQLSKKEKWSEAVEAYRRAIKLNPEDGWYYGSLGVALSKQGQYSEAEQAHQKAIKLIPESAWLYSCLAEALLNQEKWQAATDAYQQAINLEPDRFWHYSELAETLLNQEEWQAATDAYRKAIVLHPDDAHLYSKLGITLSKQEKWSEAETAYRNGIRLQPDYADFYDGLIAVLLQQGKTSEANLAREQQQLHKAVVYHRQQLRINTSNLESQRSLAEALSKLEHWDEAAVAYRYALELDSHQTWLYKSLGEALAKQGKWEEAVVAYRQAVEFAPDDFWIHNSLGKALAKQGQWAEATTIYRRAIDLNSEDTWIYDSLGAVLAKQGIWEKAVVTYRQAIKLCPDDSWLQTCLGKALAKQGQWSEALTAYRRALELEPDNFWYFEDLGDALFHQGQWEEAVVAYRQTFDQHSNLSWSHKLSFVGWSYHQQGGNLMQAGKWQEAQQAYQKALELNPDLPWHYSGLGKALEKQQKWQETTAAYGQAAAHTKGSLWFQQNPDKALQHMAGKGLVICIYTCAKHQDEQQAIRDTWLKEVIKHNIPYFFVIGKPSSRSYVEGDILYVDAPDTYEHLPRKTYKIFEYIYNYTFYSHVLKIDDDCYVNVDNLLQCGFENYDYMGKVAGYEDDLDRNWHEGKTADPTIGEYVGEHKGTWANGASGYFLNRYAMRKLMEYSNHKEIAFELYEDKLIGDILREFKIEPIWSPKYLVGVERDDQYMDCELGLVPWDETPYPHQSNKVVVFHSDNAPEVLYEIHQHFYDSNFRNRTFLKRPYSWQGWPHDNICLERVDNKEINLIFQDVLCFLVVRNELLRLPYLLEYYRSKGIRNFFVVDNHSNDGTVPYLLEQPDVYIWHTTRPYSASRWGVDWVELLLQNYGVNRWCLLVDADEILYYPDCETKSIPQLCEELDQENKQALSTNLLDMYSKEPIKDANYIQGQNFLEVCSYFDKEFYSLKMSETGPYKSQTGYWGGLRQRIFQNMEHESGKRLYCLNKVPLIKYDYSVKLCEGFHWAGNIDFSSQTGCLLHFKYFSTFHERAKQEVERGQHWNSGSEYGQYLQRLEQNPQLSFYDMSYSVEFQDSQQLLKLGIISQDG